MRRIFFVDLDDTLFQSRRKLGDDGGEPVATGRDGLPLSFMRPKQRALLDGLTLMGEVVPTTGRNLEAYGRVTLGFAGAAICSFGGVIVHAGGVVDATWHARVAAHAEPCRRALATTAEGVLGRTRGEVRARVISDAGIDLYVSVKHNTGDAAALAALSVALRREVPEGWSVHCNDNNLAVLPPHLGKHRAVAYYLDEVIREPVLSVGVGDSLSDALFMSRCDFALAPSRSQLLAALLACAR